MAITIIGNVGNVGFALPMVAAYPPDVNSQNLLGWNPTAQALDYVPYTGNVLGDFGVTRDLTVGRDAFILRNAQVDGILTAGQTVPTGAVIPFVTGPLTATGDITGNIMVATSGGNTAQLQATQLVVAASKVVGSRQTGWVALTGTPLKSTFATGTITLPQLAGIVMAMQADLITHGLIGT